jgi:hypothetical protein
MANVFGVFPLIFLAVSGIIGIVALATAVRGVLRLRSSALLREEGRETTGTVVDNQMESRGSGDNRHLVFRPVVRFWTQEGREVTAIGPNVSHRSFIKDSSVSLRYHPERPEQVEITQGQGKGSGGWGMIVGGLVVAVVAVGFVFVGWNLG